MEGNVGDAVMENKQLRWPKDKVQMLAVIQPRTRQKDTPVVGKGLIDLLGFCAKQRVAWAGALEQQSFQGAFRYAWESRILLTVTRAAYIHAQRALVKLVPKLTAPAEGRPRTGRDPLLNAGVFPFRVAAPSGWSDEVGENPFDTF